MAVELKAAGLEVTEGVGGTGVVGMVRNGDGPLILLRADMDGLPMPEKTGFDYASTAMQVGQDGNEYPSCMPAATMCISPPWWAPRGG